MEVAAALTTALGSALGLLGYRLFRAALALYGFFAGCAVVAVAGQGVFDGWVLVLAVVAGGVVGAVVAGLAERAAFFIAGAGLGWMVAAGAAAAAGVEWLVPAAIGGGVIGGVALLWLERPLVTTATSAIGAWSGLHGAFSLATATPIELTGPLPIPGPSWAPVASWVGLTAAFVGAQWLSAPRPRTQERE